jgi:hypothetical protein
MHNVTHEEIDIISVQNPFLALKTWSIALGAMNQLLVYILQWGG